MLDFFKAAAVFPGLCSSVDHRLHALQIVEKAQLLSPPGLLSGLLFQSGCYCTRSHPYSCCLKCNFLGAQISQLCGQIFILAGGSNSIDHWWRWNTHGCWWNKSSSLLIYIDLIANPCPLVDQILIPAASTSHSDHSCCSNSQFFSTTRYLCCSKLL